jgi:propanediol dehydratase large subunit
MVMTIERLISVKILFRFFFSRRIDLDGRKVGDFDLVEVEFFITCYQLRIHTTNEMMQMKTRWAASIVEA